MMPLAGKENIQSKIIIPITLESDRLTHISHTTSEHTGGMRGRKIAVATKHSTNSPILFSLASKSS